MATKRAPTLNDFEGQTCSAPEARTARMAEVVLRHAGPARPMRILDLGCGTGVLTFRLADALPHVDVTGLDVSSANIQVAEVARAGHPARERVRFIHADYLTHVDTPFDLVVTDGVLHLVPVDTSVLVRKLGADTASGGLLVVCMPYECTYNSAFALGRRALRTIRNRALDRLIMAVGRALHPEAGEAMLRERVHYIYRPPERVMNRALAGELESAGLRQDALYAMPSSSLAQLRHSVTVWRKS